MATAAKLSFGVGRMKMGEEKKETGPGWFGGVTGFFVFSH